jgi:hypothetical protein
VLSYPNHRPPIRYSSIAKIYVFTSCRCVRACYISHQREIAEAWRGAPGGYLKTLKTFEHCWLNARCRLS